MKPKVIDFIKIQKVTKDRLYPLSKTLRAYLMRCKARKINNDNYLIYTNGSGVFDNDNSHIIQSSIEKDDKLLFVLKLDREAYNNKKSELDLFWTLMAQREKTPTNPIYDSKVVFHLCRNLIYCKEILELGDYTPVLPERYLDFLSKVKLGVCSYDDLCSWVDNITREIEIGYETSNLPDKIDFDKINKLYLDRYINEETSKLTNFQRIKSCMVDFFDCS